jgi:hypothetical protein
VAAVTITNPTSNSIRIVNDLSQVVGYTIERLNETTLVYEVIENGTGSLLTLSAQVEFTVVDGIYKVTIDPTIGANEYYIELLFGALVDCYTALFSQVVCEEVSKSCCEDCSNDNKINLSNFNLLLQVYFSILQFHENFESVYDTLDSTTMNDLIQLSKVKTNLDKYCNLTSDCGCK